MRKKDCRDEGPGVRNEEWQMGVDMVVCSRLRDDVLIPVGSK